MKECLLIGGSVVLAGIFVGYVAYKIVKKNPEMLKGIMEKTSKVAAEAKNAFTEGFEVAKAEVATA